MDIKTLYSQNKTVIYIVFVFALLSACGYAAHSTVETIDNLRAEIANAKMSLDQARNKYELAKLEVEALEKKLAGLKTKEDLMKRDLELYIKAKYKKIPRTLASEISEQAVKLSLKHNAPFPIVVGIMEVESHFNPMAVSSAGARGLMQVMPFWVKKIDFLKSKYDLHDIDTGIEAGIVAFKVHLKQANNNIARGLYYYVGKDHTYKNKVFSAMGEFVAFRSTVDEEGINAVDTEVGSGDSGKNSH